MQIHDLVRCASDLDFKPLQPYSPQLPALAWRGQRLTHFEQASRGPGHLDGSRGPSHSAIGPSHSAIELSAGGPSFAEVISSLYPRLGLGELTRLCIRLKKLGWLKEFQNLMSQQARTNFDFEKLIHQLELAPSEFLCWLDQKQLRARELQIINEVEISSLAPHLAKVAELQASHGLGVKIIEILAELLLFRREIPLGDSGRQAAEGWYTDLWRARHPHTFGQDQRRRDLVKKIPWPAHVQADWVRVGDEGQLQVKFSAASGVEWQKRLSALNALLDPVKETAELWKNS